MFYAQLRSIEVLFLRTSYWIWWPYLIFNLVVLPVLSLTSPCQQSLIDQCGRLITGFSMQKYLSGLIPDSAIKDDCEAFASVRLCNDKVLRPCLAAELVTLDPFIRQANEFVTLFCENEQFRRDYAHHGQCLAVTSSDINQCITNYGSTVSDLAAISDNLTPQEVLHRSCCDGLHRLTQCSFEAAVRKCHPSSADFVKKFLYKMMKSTLQDWIARQCFEYQSQCAKDPGTIHDQNRLENNFGLSGANLTSSLPNALNVPEGLQSTVEVVTSGNAQHDPNFDTTSGWSIHSATDSLPRVTLNQPIADVTGNILSPVRPEGSDASSVSRGNESRTAEDGVVVLASPASHAVVTPAASVPLRDGPHTSEHSTGFFGSLHKPISIKTLPEKSKHRVKNFAGDTHPLARKFLLLIGTIAFLAGIN